MIETYFLGWTPNKLEPKRINPQILDTASITVTIFCLVGFLVCVCMYVCVHMEARGQPQMSFCPSCLLRYSLSLGSELID